MESLSARSRRRVITYWGFSGTVRRPGQNSERMPLLPLPDRLPPLAQLPVWAYRPTVLHSIASRIRRASPTIGTSGTRTLPISAGSTSPWMTLANGANAVRISLSPGRRSGPLLPRAGRTFCIGRGRGVQPMHAGHARACWDGCRAMAPRPHERGDDRHVGHLGETQGQRSSDALALITPRHPRTGQGAQPLSISLYGLGDAPWDVVRWWGGNPAWI